MKNKVLVMNANDYASEIETKINTELERVGLLNSFMKQEEQITTKLL